MFCCQEMPTDSWEIKIFKKPQERALALLHCFFQFFTYYFSDQGTSRELLEREFVEGNILVILSSKWLSFPQNDIKARDFRKLNRIIVTFRKICVFVSQQQSLLIFAGGVLETQDNKKNKHTPLLFLLNLLYLSSYCCFNTCAKKQ